MIRPYLSKIIAFIVFKKPIFNEKFLKIDKQWIKEGILSFQHVYLC